MSENHPPSSSQKANTRAFYFRVFLKAGLLFVIGNILFAAIFPLPFLSKISLYNRVLPGRTRLPYGENSSQSYNLSPNNLDAMFASHEISREKKSNEYRVILIGDSSVWGFLLKPEETLAGQLNQADIRLETGQQVRFYNLGYPTMSLAKDLLLLDYALQYKPDIVIWLVTLESFPLQEQLDSPIPQHTPEQMRNLIARYQLNLNPASEKFSEYTFQEKTIIGQRRPLADLIRLQAYGILWAVTDIDQYYPESYDLRQSDFDDDLSWHGLEGNAPLTQHDLAFDILIAGASLTQSHNVSFLLINEPMFISDGRNSDIRYNFFYPRHIYDTYRERLTQLAEDHNWHFLDLWNTIPPQEFTDSPVHLTPAGSAQLAQIIVDSPAFHSTISRLAQDISPVQDSSP